jgi:molybdenum cofactor synthesis domain-containing protein
VELIEKKANYFAVVITCSDGCFSGEREDQSGPALAIALQNIGLKVAATEIVPDDRSTISTVLQKYVLRSDVHLILTTGGTGFAVRDVTPEATRDVIERPAAGIAELLRHRGAEQTQLSWLSRGEAGIAGTKLIINLPGNPKAMQHSIEVLQPILFHALDLLNGKKPH